MCKQALPFAATLALVSPSHWNPPARCRQGCIAIFSVSSELHDKALNVKSPFWLDCLSRTPLTGFKSDATAHMASVIFDGLRVQWQVSWTASCTSQFGGLPVSAVLPIGNVGCLLHSAACIYGSFGRVVSDVDRSPRSSVVRVQVPGDNKPFVNANAEQVVFGAVRL